ncbi:MAG: 16S rRNA (guanine(966)-N(2))-methyltransferase RsmD [Acidimicrobiales bacterium]|nr:16S rRNA (guanine(966)-N(2))-methyltransferase RsmD [Acidimicrobiales bacterium]
MGRRPKLGAARLEGRSSSCSHERGTVRGIAVRVVAGSCRGRRLVAPGGRGTRPTSDRVREAVFAALGSLGAVEGARIVDLFAGSGALGIEALSRGASSCVFVERDRKALAAIRVNLEATGLADRATVVAGDVFSYLGSLDREPPATVGWGPAFDLALVDPPYAFEGWDRLVAELPAALAVFESDRVIELPGSWQTVRERRYGGTGVLIARSFAGQASLDKPPASSEAWSEQPE